MLHKLYLCSLAAFLAMLGLATAGCGSLSPSDSAWTNFDLNTAVQADDKLAAYQDGQAIKSRTALKLDHGFAIADGNGYIIIPGSDIPEQPQGYIEARELKLKIRELADQLVSNLDPSLKGMVALPTSFVVQDNFERTSSFGRLVAEHMYYEFNQRGLPTREYRISGNIKIGKHGEFVLERKKAETRLDPNALYLIGTYHNTGHAVFVNARLIQSDGRILRSGNLILQNNELTNALMAGWGKALKPGTLNIRDYSGNAGARQQLSPVDMGMDIHGGEK